MLLLIDIVIRVRVLHPKPPKPAKPRTALRLVTTEAGIRGLR